MQFTNKYIMVNTQAWTSCLNGCKKQFANKIEKRKNEEKCYMMIWYVIPHHINLGLHISILTYLTQNLVNLGSEKRQDFFLCWHLKYQNLYNCMYLLTP